MTLSVSLRKLINKVAEITQFKLQISKLEKNMRIKEIATSEKYTKNNNDILHIYQRVSLLSEEVEAYKNSHGRIKQQIDSFYEDVLTFKDDTNKNTVKFYAEMTNKITELTSICK